MTKSATGRGTKGKLAPSTDDSTGAVVLPLKGGKFMAEDDTESWIHPPVCMVCKKPCRGYYARREGKNKGVCNSACDKVQKKIEKDRYSQSDE